MAREVESSRNLPLAGGLAGLLDEVEDLLAGGQAVGRFAGHYSSPAKAGAQTGSGRSLNAKSDRGLPIRNSSPRSHSTSTASSTSSSAIRVAELPEDRHRLRTK